jgi:hypothetical protein
MMEKTKGRGEIKKEIKHREAGLKDSGQHMEGVTDDGQTVARAAHEVRRSTTSEGAQEVEGAIRKAGQETRKEFERQNQGLEKKMQECKKAEEYLQQRTDNAKKDAQASKGAADGMKETNGARNQMRAAEEASLKDGQFTTEQRQRQELDRKESEERRNKQNRDLYNAKADF